MPLMRPKRDSGCERSRPRSSRSCSLTVPARAAPAHVGAVVLDVAHALHAAGQHHVGRTGLHHHGGGGDGLHAAAAAAVELHAADLDRESPPAAPPSGRCRAFRRWCSSARTPRRRCAPGPARCAARPLARRWRPALPPARTSGRPQRHRRGCATGRRWRLFSCLSPYGGCQPNRPPLTCRTSPLMKLARSLARKVTASAMSVGRPTRLIGCASIARSRIFS
jgi:hypothetical protein